MIDDSTEWADTLHAAAAELRGQHARIEELEDVADMAIKRIAELEAQLSATHPTQQGLDARDAAFEAVRKAFCNLQRYSFSLDSRGNVRRCADRSGNWVEFEAAHTLFEPQSVDAALAQEGWCDGCNPDNCVGCGPAAPAQVQPEPNREQS